MGQQTGQQIRVQRLAHAVITEPPTPNMPSSQHFIAAFRQHIQDARAAWNIVVIIQHEQPQVKKYQQSATVGKGMQLPQLQYENISDPIKLNAPNIFSHVQALQKPPKFKILQNWA